MALGQSLADQLRDAISICDACVFIATRRSLDSHWCLTEIGAFWGAGKRVIIYHADPDVSESQLPVKFQGNLWTRDAARVLETLRRLQSLKEMQRRTCFVTMPLGKKTVDVTMGGESREIDFDWVYFNIFEPAINSAELPPNEGGGKMCATRVDIGFQTGHVGVE